MFGVEEVLLEEVHRRIDVRLDARVVRDAKHLRRTDEGVDLLVRRDGVVVIAELRGQDLLLVLPVDLDGVEPVAEALDRVAGLEVLAQVLDPGLGGLQEAVLAGHVVGRREPVDEP